MKRCGKSAPAPGVTRAARQTPPEARSRSHKSARTGGAQAFEGGPPESAGRPLERAGDGTPRWMVAERDRREAPGNRTRLTGRLIPRAGPPATAVQSGLYSGYGSSGAIRYTWPTGQIGLPIGTSTRSPGRSGEGRSCRVNTDSVRPHCGHLVTRYLRPVIVVESDRLSRS